MTFKRGISPAAAPAASEPQARIVGRQLQTVRQTQIVTPQQAQTVPAPNARIIAQPAEAPPPQHVRGLLVGGDGKPLIGLSQATIQAHKAQTEDATETCYNCGRLCPPAHMKTVVTNAYNSSNPLRLCNMPPKPGEPPSCTQLAYKDPYAMKDNWRPSIPVVRFDRETAAPYEARKRGVTIGDLVNRDTYHNEREVESKFVQDGLAGEGRWSGGGRAGHQVTPESLAQSRERRARVGR